ncbi:hypothetical protein BpJC7_03730 [Weizmannia acidilactici]|uniref:YlqD protein n=1 Tax=Weizmannia acidilactici TaxID=2607726 RepID=A0A5J4JF51_9BACI|nr:YlqD family protein [Weizmannia acidilactici]GER65600.1 hypothetical protein BpJC4_00710 [Weizmannia acidilactici]GER69070.1 hypothetical protein BpJC7_03730 [Weizmannia acidilactici]GER71957.1 hypothetical protein BpPP18_00240 [Weizmannia acidilactici]
MKILQKVTVKQILTEKSKEALLSTYRQTKQQLQKECDQLRFESKRLEKTKKYSGTSLKMHFEKEINSRQEKIKLVDFQIEQLLLLPLGTELKETEIQAVVDIHEGDDWDAVSKEKTIIVKDGIIHEIRER